MGGITLVKTLLLLRHGKAESYNADSDRERMLTGRGARDASSVGEWLADGGLLPDLVIASDAARARQTANLAAEAMHYDSPIAHNSALYGASLETLLNIVRDLPDQSDRALLVGHNPGFEELAHCLAASAPPFGAMPTAGIVALRFDSDQWSNISEQSGDVVGYFAPHAKHA